MKIFLIAVLLIVPSSHCYVVKDDEGEDTTSEPLSREKDPEDMNKILEDVSKAIFGDDTELIKEIAEEIDEEMTDSSKEVVQGMKRNFLASLMRLHQGGELYKDARREAILSSLYSALKESSGDVDPSFVADLTQKLEQKEQQRRQKVKEYETNAYKAQTGESLQNKK